MNSFSKNVLIVSLGPLISSVVSFLAEPWIARFWPPEIFGMVSYYNAFIMTITPVIFLRYNYAMIQSSKKEEQENLLVFSSFLLLVGMTLILAIFPVFSRYFSADFSFDSYKNLFFIAIFFGALNILFRGWASANKFFYHISISVILLQSSFTLLLLFFGILGKNDPDTIIRIRTFSYVISPMYMLIQFFRTEFKSTLENNISLNKISNTARKYSRFPKIEFWGYLAGIVASNIPIVIIANYWGQEINGLFSKAFFILYMFTLFIGESVGKVLHKEIADMTNRQQKFDAFLLIIVKTLVTISILPFSILIMTGPELFSIFLGQQWYESGVFASLISIWMFSIILSFTVTPVFAVLNKQQYYTGFQVTTVLLRVILLMVLGMLQVNIFISIFIFSIVNFVILIFKIFTALKLSGVDLINNLYPLSKPILQTTPIFIAFYLISWLFAPSSLMTLVIVAILSLPYVYLFYFQGDAWKYFSAVLLKRKL